MNSTRQKRDRRSTLCFVSLEFIVILLPCLIFFDVSSGTGFFGEWAVWILVCLLVVLLAMSLIYLSRRRSLAIWGILIFVSVTAAGLILPLLYPPPTKGHRTEQVAAHEPPPGVSSLGAPVSRTLDPLPTPGSSGGR
ncbi:MAG TPA: hypothetical protein PLX89_26785 [Verrucomicrobiota bacterium]|nr:hypothetical protein [Verrucomicrobiota bacterium]